MIRFQRDNRGKFDGNFVVTTDNGRRITLKTVLDFDMNEKSQLGIRAVHMFIGVPVSEEDWTRESQIDRNEFCRILNERHDDFRHALYREYCYDAVLLNSTVRICDTDVPAGPTPH